MKKLKVAIVYDRVNKWGGAERVLLALHEIFPDAPLFTSVYDKKRASWAKIFPKIYTSFLQRIPFARNKHEFFGWLMPIVFEQFDFSKFDLVISVTSESAKGIITKPNTYHINYLLTPTRYLWSGYEDYFSNKILRFLSKPIVNYLRKWDKIASNRPDKIIAISTEVQKRIKKYYDRDSEIVFPPGNFPEVSLVKHSRGVYYLVVSRLVKYKKVDLAIKAFNKLNLPLVIVGVGKEERYLKSIANKNIKFIGQVTEKQLINYYKNAKALILPQDEDFGIVAVEAQSFGVPVIAYKSGGALDIVNEKTGLFFTEQNEKSLMQAVKKFAKMTFSKVKLRNNARRFDKRQFKRKLQRSLVRTDFGRRWRNTSVAKIEK